MDTDEQTAKRIKIRDGLIDLGFTRTSFTSMDPKDPKKRYKESWSNGADRIMISWNGV